MRILIVVPDQDRISGNWVTAQRFRLGLEKAGYQVALHGIHLQADAQFKKFLLGFAPDVAILLHAYRSGRPWMEATEGQDFPYVVLLTGTDVNSGLDDPGQSLSIRTVLQQAAFVLLQNSLIATEFAASYPGLAVNLRVLLPGITLGTANYDLRKKHAIERQQTLFLCPAGLRPVKGVLELLRMFDPLAKGRVDFHLAFCGPILDQIYGRQFLAEIAKRPWASYLGTIPYEAMAQAMSNADVILNNSQTEGLSNTLLEATVLGIPILASNIPGNATVVKHNRNGLLYNNQAEFARYALQLLNRERRQQLALAETTLYNPQNETDELIKILQDVGL